ncbi:MAG: (2Fe-2S)-binding protein [Chloroherpetonaceae bacterium]|nr:(2Fe-2S)-binding protein [Chloroherpetonaceae bacterium]MDW8437967.1 2Fe-2S iron-sulfur cluster-binding protein [Chloroherpetonaceae bacterium]
MPRIVVVMRQADGTETTRVIEKARWLDGESLQSLALDEGLRIGGACGGMGLCTTCRVEIIEGAESLSRLTREEKDFRAQNLLKETERLACQCSPTGDVTLRYDP